MDKKVITIELSEDGVSKAIAEIETYKRDLSDKVVLLRQKIAEKIAEEAKSGFNGAIVEDLTGMNAPRLAQVDVSVTEEGNVSVVVANGEDAVWVEFGAGVYHNGSPGSSPHPKGAELGMTIGTYGEGYGSREVWGFYEEDRLVLTHGTPAAMPMSNAVSTIINDIALIAREVFG